MSDRDAKTQKQLRPHSAADLIPSMTDHDYALLKADIGKYGQREPIITLDNLILDGRHRYQACLELDIEPLFKPVTELTDPVAFVLSANLHRRHLTASQRAMIAARVAELYAAEAAERGRSGLSADGAAGGRGRKKNPVAKLPQGFKTREKAGKKMGVGGRSVQDAKTVIDNGSPELVAAVEAGQVPVSKAASIAKSTPKPRQAAVAKSASKSSKTKKGAATKESTKSAAPSFDSILATQNLERAVAPIYLNWPMAERTSLEELLGSWVNELHEFSKIASLDTAGGAQQPKAG
jgi:ParB-like chromosome segregation protein Spo0J